jgi:glutathione S-transferase
MFLAANVTQASGLRKASRRLFRLRRNAAYDGHMLVLHHWPLDPFSRQVRIALAEKGSECHLVEVNPFAPDPAWAAMTFDGRPPVLVDEGAGRRTVVPDARAALEYLEELAPTPTLLPGGPAERAATRALAHWIDRAFDAEVNAFVLHERIEKRLARAGAPDPANVRRGLENLKGLMLEIGRLAGDHGFLAGDRFSHADIAAAAHLSVLDYAASVDWDAHPAARVWYATVKSRKSVRTLLTDVAPGLPPPPHYADLDF